MQIALFRSALGLRAVEHDLAAALRADGHDVLLPDLYDGRTAETVADGLELKDAVGRYPGVGHFFTDPALADYDEEAARTVSRRVRSFLRDVARLRR